MGELHCSPTVSASTPPVSCEPVAACDLASDAIPDRTHGTRLWLSAPVPSDNTWSIVAASFVTSGRPMNAAIRSGACVLRNPGAGETSRLAEDLNVLLALVPMLAEIAVLETDVDPSADEAVAILAALPPAASPPTIVAASEPPPTPPAGSVCSQCEAIAAISSPLTISSPLASPARPPICSQWDAISEMSRPLTTVP